MEIALDTPNFRAILFSIFYITFFCLVLLILSFNIYDQNYPVNRFVDTIFNKNDLSSDRGDDDYLIMNFESNISSENLLYLFYLAKESGVNYLVMADSFNNLNDKTRLSLINRYIQEQDNYFFLSLFEGGKSLSLFGDRYLVDKNRLVYFDSKEDFVYSHSSSDIETARVFDFRPAQLGLFPQKLSYFGRSNIELFYKFNDKYLPTLPLLIYVYENGKGSYALSDLKFGYSRLYKVDEQGKREPFLFYDQKGRAGVSGITYNERSVEIALFDSWDEILQRRRKLLDELVELGLFNPQKSGYNLFLEEEDFLNEIYDLESTGKRDIDSRLELIKARAGEWNAFKVAGRQRFSGKALLLTGGGEFGWIDDFINQKEALQGELLRRMPVPVNYLLALVFFLVNMLGFVILRKRIFHLLIPIVTTTLALVLYLIFRFGLAMEFPFILLAVAVVSGSGLGLLLSIFIDIIWKRSVFTIYKDSISSETNKMIVDYWRESDWRFELKDHIATFLMVDTRDFVNNSSDEENVEIISDKTSDIEDIVKSRYGVIDSLDPRRILAYFGNPPIREAHVNDALESARQIGEVSVVLDSGELMLYTALHSKKEWFKMVKRKGELHYGHFGTSLSILPAMLRVARTFQAKVVISDNVYKVARGEVAVRMLDRIRINGVEGSIRIFELLDEKRAKELGEMLDYFHAGLKLFENQLWKEAAAYFKQCLKLVPEDLPSEIFLQRANDFLYVPPKDNWDGIYEVDY